MKKLISYEFNIDTACEFADGTMITLTAPE
ncbi:DUF6061 family protein [Bacteroides caecimuris]|nr:DUF6061 family protein [Bacteroides caecimuris]